MKKLFGLIGGISLITMSFYLTDRVSLMVTNKSDLMQRIVSEQDNYYVEPVNAIVNGDDNTIIPGKNGKEVDKENSYLNMHDFGVFNYNYLILKDIKPNISLEDNKDKYIISGNPKNRTVSLIVYNNPLVENLLNVKQVNYSIVTSKLQEFSQKAENVNAAINKEDFKMIDSKISDASKHICITNYSDLKLCNKYNYYIVKPQIFLQEFNIIDVKNAVSNGSIILINNNATLENVNLLLNEIKFKDLNITNLSDLISEKNQ